MYRRGITLIELLVAIAIAGILIALLLPAVQGVRESARRTRCTSQVRQLVQAMHDYEGVHGVLPTAGPNKHGWLVLLLPHVEQQDLYNQFDLNENIATTDNPLSAMELSLYRCPSDRDTGGPNNWGPANYAGNCGHWWPYKGWSGIFQSAKPNKYLGGGLISLSAISDGTSHTAAVSEVLVANGTMHRRRVHLSTTMATSDLNQFTAMCLDGAYAVDGEGQPIADILSRGRPWTWSGMGHTWYNHTLSPNQPSCSSGGTPNAAFTAASNHPGGVVLGYADGHVVFENDSVDVGVWRRIGVRNDGRPNF
jgi:prepilin-type N-terminal cleavage/methylation domain-containing protein/prepilin-type processing-associated H-X9-DG protein